jgi:hypothetical protein
MSEPLIEVLRLCIRITQMPHCEERFRLVKSINVMLNKYPEELHGNPVANHAMLTTIIAVSADM